MQEYVSMRYERPAEIKVPKERRYTDTGLSQPMRTVGRLHFPCTFRSTNSTAFSHFALFVISLNRPNREQASKASKISG